MTPQQIIFLSIVGIALVALIFLSESQKRYNLDSIKRKTVGDGQYGTARWATQEEIQSSTIQVPYEPEAWRHNKESRPTTAGIVVNLKQNKKQILATIDPSDSHTLMVAGTGGGKTTTFMIPNIEYALACGTSFISTDSKGDLLRLYGKLCEQYGYTCLNINFRTPMKSDSYNYMQLINLYIDMWRDDPKRVDYHSRAERYAKALANSIAIFGFLFTVVLTKIGGTQKWDEIFTRDTIYLIEFFVCGSFAYMILCFFEIRFKLKKTKEGYIQLKENYRDILSDIEIKEAFKDDELLRNTESSTRRSTIIWSIAWGILLVAAIIIIEVFTANHGLFVWLWNKVF